ncbi:MAG TPA: outer membrane beta-barrel protein [Polyangiaceae bacterium]|jgi:hypothetical protein|nr:outer membrane beta-barrel protein [Polyangiaceae bacterium]
MRKLTISILLAASAFTFYAETASAMGASAGVLVGNGFKDGYNLGIGARGGVTLPMSLYVGGTILYHLGKTETIAGGDVTANIWYLGAEGGYDLGAGPLTIRPYLGVGYANLRVSAPDVCVLGTCAGGGSHSDGKLAFWPGVTGLIGLGGLFVGADVRYVLLVDVEDGNAFSAFATVGMGF